MSTSNGKMLIFVPTYEEHENVGEMCKQLHALGLDADILFIDDNSPDGTGAILDKLAEQHPRMTVLHRTGKLGIGSAHQDGIAWAYDHDYDTLVTLDCDFTHSPTDIPRLLEPQGCELTVGSRYMRDNSLPDWNLIRRFLTNFGHLLTKGLLGIQYDATGALRIYRLNRIPRPLFALVQARSYGFFFESMFILGHNGVRIAELPIVLPNRMYGHSKMSIKEVWRSGLQVFSLWAASVFRPGQFRLDSWAKSTSSGATPLPAPATPTQQR
jgi:dolichol-phosphate mannosyltransferase